MVTNEQQINNDFTVLCDINNVYGLSKKKSEECFQTEIM